MDLVLGKYLCKHCGENNHENFYVGRYTTCKKCRNKANYASVAHKSIERDEPKTLKDSFDNFMVSDIKVFKGETPYGFILNLNKEVKDLINFKEEIEKRSQEISDNQDDINTFLSKYINETRRFVDENDMILKEFQKRNDELIKENQEIRKENQEIRKENQEIRKENQEIKEKMEKLFSNLNVL